jgi:hypothetical protein
MTPIPPSRRLGRIGLPLALAAIATAFCLAAAFPVNAPARSSYCSPSGDYCEGAARVNGRIVLRFSTFSLRGRLKVCVTKRTRRCRSPLLRPIGNDVYRAKIWWRSHFPYQGHGTYRVRWYTRQGNALGVPLKFRR